MATRNIDSDISLSDHENIDDIKGNRIRLKLMENPQDNLNPQEKAKLESLQNKLEKWADKLIM